MRSHPFEPVSAWLRQPPDDLQPALAETRSADVAIVGAGCTGLSAALALRAQGADVVVLEQEFAGAGASGRNAGYLAGPAVMDLPLALRRNGRAGVEGLVAFAREAVTFSERLLEAQRIDCDYHRSGVILAAVHPRQEARVGQWLRWCEAFGCPLLPQSRAELAERGIPAAFRSGLYDATGGVFDPGRLVSGLRRRTLEAGVRLFEGTRVERLEDGAEIRLETGSGVVRAEHAILATNAYTPELRARPRSVLPLRVSGFETAPLDDRQLEALGWRGFEGINTLHEVLESYRRTDRRSIVGTSKDFAVGWRRRRPAAYAPGSFALLEEAFHDRFPMLAGLPVARFWSGWIAHTTDFRPLLGVSGRRGNLLRGLGYCGHGVAQALLMGDVLAERVAGRSHPLEAHVRRRVLAWPPDPLTFGAVSLLRAGLRWLDGRVDRELRGPGP